MTQPGAVLFTVPYDGSADAVAFSADAKHIASGGSSTTIDIRAVGIGAQHTIPAKGFVTSLAFAPDGTSLAVADFDTVAVWRHGENGPTYRPRPQRADAEKVTHGLLRHCDEMTRECPPRTMLHPNHSGRH